MLTSSLRSATHWLKPSRAVGPRSLQRRALSEARRVEKSLADRPAEQLRERAFELQAEGRLKKALSRQQLSKAVGTVAAAVYRTHGFRLHDVQVQAILAGSAGAIVEMQTGEGKTVVTGSIAAIKAMQSSGIHVGTTNAYLAQRDLEENQQMFGLLGLTAGMLPDGNNVQATRAAYAADITYGPGYQFGFDYLRDQVDLRNNRQSRLGCQTMNRLSGYDPTRNLRQPQELHVAIMDEADSVMIDEAVTPMVISGVAQGEEEPAPFEIARQLAEELKLDEDFTLEMPEKKITINEDALTRCHQAIAQRRDLVLSRPWKVYVENAIRAQRVFHRDVDYVVKQGEIMIVDQHTGRIFDDRTWQDGLHQAVECKEAVKINKAPGSVAQITRQRYLMNYETLAGLTGTASGARQEFRSVYGCRVVPVPTNLPNVRKILRPRCFGSHEAKLNGIAADVLQRTATGQPILIGTRTIRESIQVAETLVRCGLNPLVLNGVQDQEESEIVALAGRAHALTIATNMAGRGTDIKPDARALEAGGLHVIGVSPNGSPRVDRQLVGRAARQGNPGSAQFFVSAEDEIIEHNAPSLARRMKNRAGRNGEVRADLAKELLQMQLKMEKKQFMNRQAMVQRDRWMAKVRRSIERD